MLSWLMAKARKIQNKNKTDICKNCIWHKAEEDFGIKQLNKHLRFCSYLKVDTPEYDSCDGFQKEWFVGKPGSTQTEEFSLDLETSIEKEKLETH